MKHAAIVRSGWLLFKKTHERTHGKGILPIRENSTKQNRQSNTSENKNQNKYKRIESIWFELIYSV